MSEIDHLRAEVEALAGLLKKSKRAADRTTIAAVIVALLALANMVLILTR